MVAVNETDKVQLSNGWVLEIVPDPCAESPREWDNLGVFYMHKDGRYDIGDGHEPVDGDDWHEIERNLRCEHDAHFVIPVYMLDHSGIQLSTSPFNDPWDSGQVGFIYCTSEAVDNFKRSCDDKDKVSFCKHVHRILSAEIDEYSTYLNGDVYGYKLYEPEYCKCCGNTSWTLVDACYGFYGYDHKKSGLYEAAIPTGVTIVGDYDGE